MKIVRTGITIEELIKLAENRFGNLVKAVVDIKKEIMVVDADLHSDQEALLLEKGSSQDDLWGINLYPEKKKDWIEFDSMINLRPYFGNQTRGVEDEKTRQKIIQVVNKLVKR
jgi:hypothetical protein